MWGKYRGEEPMFYIAKYLSKIGKKSRSLHCVEAYSDSVDSMCSNHDPRGLGWTTIFLFYIEKNPEKKSLEIQLSKPIGKTICNLCKSIFRYRVESSLFKWWYPGYIEWVHNGVRKGECFSRKKFDYSRKLKC